MSFSDYAEDAILNHLRGTAWTPPPGLYVGLYSAAPTDAGGGTEVTTTIRPGGRVAAAFGAPAAGSMANSAVVDFGSAAGAATVTHFAIFDAASGGNMLMWGAFAAPVNVAVGNIVSFAAGALIVGVD